MAVALRATEDRNFGLLVGSMPRQGWRSSFGAAEDLNGEDYFNFAEATLKGGRSSGRPRIATRG